MKPLSLYIHVPFCVKKCPYCDFYSVTQGTFLSAYLDTLEDALTKAPEHTGPRELSCVYFGGGTPSLLPPRSIRRILSHIRTTYSLAPDCEITMELNPDNASPEYLDGVFQAGINRLSLGVQSLIPEELSALDRLHTAKQARQAIRMAQEAGFQNISADLMLGIPCQTPDSALMSIRQAVSLGITHLSLYMLSLPEGTPFGTHPPKGCMGEDALCDTYLACITLLESLGLSQYEVSNFARPGQECRHNLCYWTLGDYLGLGPSAHSLIEGTRYFFPARLEALLRIEDPFSLWQKEGEGGTLEEEVMLRLRLTSGLDMNTLPVTLDLPAAWQLIAVWARRGLLTVDGSHIRLTPAGFLISNDMIARLLLALDVN